VILHTIKITSKTTILTIHAKTQQNTANQIDFKLLSS